MEMLLESLPGVVGFSYLLGVYYADRQLEKQRMELAIKMHWNGLIK